MQKYIYIHFYSTSVLQQICFNSQSTSNTRHVSMKIADVHWQKFHSQSRTTCFLSCFTSLLVDPVVEKQLIAATKEGTEDWGGWHPAVKTSFFVDLEYVIPSWPLFPKHLFGPIYIEWKTLMWCMMFPSSSGGRHIAIMISSTVELLLTITLSPSPSSTRCVKKKLIHPSIHSTFSNICFTNSQPSWLFLGCKVKKLWNDKSVCWLECLPSQLLVLHCSPHRGWMLETTPGCWDKDIRNFRKGLEFLIF